MGISENNYFSKFMTVKRKIVYLNIVAAAITVLIGSMLVRQSWNKRSQLQGFEKVSALLVAMIDLGETWTTEGQGVWDTSEEHTKQSSTAIGVSNYKTKIEETNKRIIDLRSLISDIDLENHSERFRELVSNGLDFESRLNPIRSGIIDDGGEPWPATLEYVKQTKWLFGLIPQIATESADPELVRKVMVADLTLQLKLSMEIHSGALIWALSTGNCTETVVANARSKLDDIPPLVQRIGMLVGESSLDEYRNYIQSDAYHSIISTTETLVEMGSTRGAGGEFPSRMKSDAEEAVNVFRAHLPKFVSHLHEDIREHTTEKIGEANAAMLQSVTMIVAALLICGLGGGYIVRSIDRSIRGVVAELEETSKSGQEMSEFVSGAAGDLADGCSEQAACVEEIHSTVTLIQELSDESVNQVTAVRTNAANSNEAARAGTDSMLKMRGAMNRIHESSSDIAKIAKEIEEIAFQTNILALNAAVEAARAGEAGAGFAIVADEVRSLAQKSAVSATSTREKIKNAQDSIAEGDALSVEVDSRLRDILTQTGTFSSSMSEVESIAEQQRSAIGEVAKAIVDIDHVTQKNAASAEESASAAANLDGNSQHILSQIYGLESFLIGSMSANHAARLSSKPAINEPTNSVPLESKRINDTALWN